MLKKTVTYFIAAGLTVTSIAAIAHGGATGVIKERMDAMVDMKDSMKTVSDMFKGKTPYDAEQVKAAADVIKGHSGEALTSLFPQGSLQHPSEAKAIIWEEWERFSGLANRLGVLSEGLSKAADNAASPMQQKTEMGHAGMMGKSSMMASADMMGESMNHSAEEYGKMPVDRVFKMVTDNCSSCHTRFRKEKDK